MSSIIHLIAPAGNLKSLYQHLGVEDAAQMVSLFQEYVGSDFQLTANMAILDAAEDELRGGRFDDGVRARDISEALADDNVAAILAVRGGAWFTRILPKIDFSVLDRRANLITVFGFSELTPLINIVAHHSMGRGYHDMGPAFLVYGLKRHAEHVLKLSDATIPTPEQWMLHNLRKELAGYLKDVVRRVTGGIPSPDLSASLAHGQLKDGATASFVGGNLTVLSTMLGSKYADSITPEGSWLLLEDFNDKPERLDRFLAHFTLAGYWDRCEGLLLGDFHRGHSDLLPAVLAMLEYHLPGADFPVLATQQIGHIWPMTPLPINRAGCWKNAGNGQFKWVCD